MNKMAGLRSCVRDPLRLQTQLEFVFPITFSNTQYSNNANNEAKEMNPISCNKVNSELLLPIVPEPNACCGDGCENCIWLEYVYHVKFHYRHDKQKVKEALDQIPDINTRFFVENELKRRDDKND